MKQKQHQDHDLYFKITNFSQLSRMNTTLGNLLIRRASTSNYLSFQYLRHKPTTFPFLYRKLPNLQTYQLSTGQRLLLEKTYLNSAVVDTYYQLDSRTFSSKLPLFDIGFDLRELHHISQFGLAVQLILPSK